MPIQRIRWQVAPWGLALVLAAWAAAHGEEKDISDRAPATLREMIDRGAHQFEVFVSEDADKPARAIEALRWANNARGSEDGVTVLYIHAGRPIATACLYPWAGNLVHDFEAISRDSVVARDQGTIIWRPRQSSVKFADIPGAPAPAESPTQRLRQMKALAEQFQSTLVGWKADNTDREELRLLQRPLYRYEIKDDGPILDGAVFAFVMGTDPESLLLIESVNVNGAPRWQFAFARRTSGELEGRHRDKVVWNAPRYPETKDPQRPHFSKTTPIPPELAADARK